MFHNAIEVDGCYYGILEAFNLCTHTHTHTHTHLPGVADQLSGIIGRHTGQVWTTCVINPLTGKIESRGKFEERGPQFNDQCWPAFDEVLHEWSVTVH